MNTLTKSKPFDWMSKRSWKKSAHNTFWCLLGCTLGNFFAIALFHAYAPNTAVWLIISIALLTGLITSITLETLILANQFKIKEAIKIAFGMSFISMIVMQLITNIVNLLLVGDLKLSWWAMAPSLIAGFLSVWPYNYYKLKKYGKSCH